MVINVHVPAVGFHSSDWLSEARNDFVITVMFTSLDASYHLIDMSAQHLSRTLFDMKNVTHSCNGFQSYVPYQIFVFNYSLLIHPALQCSYLSLLVFPFPILSLLQFARLNNVSLFLHSVHSISYHTPDLECSISVCC